MKSLCIVFPMPARYFDDMIEACVELHNFYQNASVHPLYVSTLKRPCYLENDRGDYGEFERGDRFIVFQGAPESFHLKALFCDRFPSAEILREVEWEGVEFHVGVMPIDDLLQKRFADLGVGVNAYSENDWMLVEDFNGFITFSQTS